MLPEAAPWRIAGEVLNTYIICEDDAETLWLIDKHAAHERVRFDALKNNTQPVMSQQLLSPLAVELSAEDAASLLEQLPLLEEFGFVCEDFGDGTVLVRQVLILLAYYTLQVLVILHCWYPLAYCTKTTNVLTLYKLN